MYQKILCVLFCLQCLYLFPQQIFDRNYFQHHNIQTIELVIPVSKDWINRHNAFDSSLNAQWFLFTYNNQGLCTELKWKFCHINNNKVDTNIQTLENSIVFEYDSLHLSSIYVYSFSDIHHVSYNYLNHNKIIRKIIYSTKTEVNIDTLNNNLIFVENFNPYYFPMFPYVKALFLDFSFTHFIKINQIPFNELHTEYNGFKFILCPILSIEFK
ncbi:MAG: hypothetical protein N2449_06370 [Bacteroidales bacterium]|nr:hypothetical protein [Bacteroidales bacterium]